MEKNYIGYVSVPNDIDGITLNKLTSKLSINEKKRTNHFNFKRKKEFVIGRVLLQQLIKDKIKNFNPTFKSNPYGKLLVYEEEIHVNISHSNKFIIAAVTGHSEIGIDIEYINYDLKIWDLIPHVFNVNEIELFFKSPNFITSYKNFYSLWTIKESILKGLGMGFSYPVQSIDITSIARPFFGEWRVTPLNFSDDYKGALAVKKNNLNPLEITEYTINDLFNGVEFNE